MDDRESLDGATLAMLLAVGACGALLVSGYADSSLLAVCLLGYVVLASFAMAWRPRRALGVLGSLLVLTTIAAVCGGISAGSFGRSVVAGAAWTSLVGPVAFGCWLVPVGVLRVAIDPALRGYRPPVDQPEGSSAVG